MKLQYRTTSIEDTEPPGFTGYASTFWDVDSYWSAVKPGAFKKTIKERAAKMPILWQHSSEYPIGKPRELKEDRTGLWFDAEVVEETRAGGEAMALLRAGVPLGVSIGFQTLKDRSAEDDDPLNFAQNPDAKPKDIRVITEVKLYEFSLVTFAANESAEPNNIRSTELPDLIEAIKAGDLTEEQRVRVEELLAAWQEVAEPVPDPVSTPLTPTDRDRKRETDIVLALARSRGWIGAVQA